MSSKQLKNPPVSCANWWINLTGLGFMLLGLWLLVSINSVQSTVESIFFLLAFTLLPILILEFYFQRPALLRRAAVIDLTQTPNISRILIKLLGLYVIFISIAFLYWLLPEYAGSFYQPFWTFVQPVVPWLIGLSLPYFWLVDSLQEAPEDEYFALGSYLLRIKGRHKENEKYQIGQLIRGWLVKCFFLPLMIVYLGSNIGTITNGAYSVAWIWQDFEHFFDWLWLILLTVDLAFVSIGYCVTLKIIDSNIRSTEPTMLGWVVALICYDPFSSSIFSTYTAYNPDGLSWDAWLGIGTWLYLLWGIAILLLMTIYTLSSVAFGHRFSNLTHRGIITNGPYRYSKHPAYITKNISWWLISIPFISLSADFIEVFRSCALLLLINYIYYLRAKTEEQHLLVDPVYVEYSEWIYSNGIIAKIKRKFLR